MKNLHLSYRHRIIGIVPAQDWFVIYHDAPRPSGPEYQKCFWIEPIACWAALTDNSEQDEDNYGGVIPLIPDFELGELDEPGSNSEVCHISQIAGRFKHFLADGYSFEPDAPGCSDLSCIRIDWAFLPERIG